MKSKIGVKMILRIITKIYVADQEMASPIKSNLQSLLITCPFR